MIAPELDRDPSPVPSPDGIDRSEDPGATTSYISAAGPRRFAFLGPPRAEGEIGWLAHYRVRSLIGEGGIGLVFLADDTQLSRPIALKIIRPEMAGAPEVRSRFLREAQATAAIKHDHIVTLHQVGREGETLFLAMEYLRGVSLQRWLERGHRPSVGLVLRIGREIAAGLAAAHRAGLVHRDIKPANIWLEAPSGRVKILDFGMARSERDDVQITRSGTVMGTPTYMAPEQARGEPVGPAGDLFSLGCVLYQLCAGRLPFQGDSIMAVLAALASETPRPPRELNPDVPPGLDALVMRLLAKTPGERPASAQDVVETFREMERQSRAEGTQAPSPPTATRGGEPRPPGPRAGRRRWAIAVALLVTASAAAIAGFALGRSRKVRPEVAAAPSARVPARDGRSSRGSRETTPLPPRPGPPAEGRKVAKEKEGPSRPGTLRLAAATGPEPSTDPGPATSRDVPRVAGGGGDRSSRGIAEETGSPRAGAQATPVEVDWGGLFDPDGDCRIDLDRTGRMIRIAVPGTPHILSAELGRMNAPRLDRDVRGDFEARVRVAGVFHPAGRATVREYAPYHGAGLLLWQDADNYVRLEIAADLSQGKRRPYVNFEYRKDGVLAVSRGMLNPNESSRLRLRRHGDEISAAFGPDGVHWTTFPTLSARLVDRLKVGVVAINSATRPLTAVLDEFEVSERPRAVADPNPVVTGP